MSSIIYGYPLILCVMQTKKTPNNQIHFDKKIVLYPILIVGYRTKMNAINLAQDALNIHTNKILYLSTVFESIFKLSLRVFINGLVPK